MARKKIDRDLMLKNFVAALRTAYGAGPYTRSQIQELGKMQPIGQSVYASTKGGFGNATRLSRGMYMTPASWATNPPWVLGSSTAASN